MSDQILPPNQLSLNPSPEPRAPEPAPGQTQVAFLRLLPRALRDPGICQLCSWAGVCLLLHPPPWHLQTCPAGLPGRSWSCSACLLRTLLGPGLLEAQIGPGEVGSGDHMGKSSGPGATLSTGFSADHRGSGSPRTAPPLLQSHLSRPPDAPPPAAS